MKKKIFLIVSLCSIMCACTKNSSYEEKINELRDSINELSHIIELYQNEPAKVAADIDQLYQERNLTQLQTIYKNLLAYHPEALETQKTKQYIVKIQAENEAKILAEKEAKRKSIKKLKKKYDDVSGIIWYMNPYFVHYNNSNHVSLYMGQTGETGLPWLRLVMSYEGDNWIFFENAYLSYDGETINIPFNEYENKKSDNEGGRVWEWIDVRVDNEMLNFLREMIKGKNVKMRLSGKYTTTRTLSTVEKNGIRDVIQGYDFLCDPENR